MYLSEAIEKARDLARPALQIVTGAFLIAALLVSYLLIYEQGAKDMHNALTSDMAREKEAGIPARNPSGAFYLYTYSLTFCEWIHYHRIEKK